MNFIKKANTSMKDIQTLKSQMDKMGITKKIESFTGKDKQDQASVTVTDMGTAPAGQQQQQHLYPPPPSAPGQQHQYAPPQASGQYQPQYGTAAAPASAHSPLPSPTPSPGPAHAIPAGLNLAVPVNTAEGAPQKLPLVARKSIRDHFESRKSAIEGQLTAILGTPWSIHVDTAGVYSYSNYNETISKDPGTAFISYFDALVYYIDSFVKTFGDDGRQQLNRLAHAHVATLEPTFDQNIANCTCDFAEGKLRLLFRDSHLGIESASASESLDQIVRGGAGHASEASGSGPFSLAARQSIRDDYEKSVGEQLHLMRSYLAAPTIELVPNFEANYKKLVAYESSQDISAEAQNVEHKLSSKIGAATLAYFLGLNNQLYWKGFYSDEMMRDAFKESIFANKVELRAVDQGDKTTADCAIEDGVLIIRAPVTQWWQNPDAACQSLEDLL